jgi:hypothetical protein
MWNPHSVMFEVAWCVMLYTTVLFLEFLPMVFDRFGWHKPIEWIHGISVPLMIVGVLLSTLHQSSLGSLFLIVPEKLYPFTRFFQGFENVPTVRKLFGKRTVQVLRTVKVEFFSARFGYMGTSDVDGHLLISSRHLGDSDFKTVYLDLVHELCHVRQFRRGRPLFYPKLSYVDAPSEIEAYRLTIEEARRIGMTNRQMIDYLKVEWITPAEHRRLCRRCGLAWSADRARPHRKRIRK